LVADRLISRINAAIKQLGVVRPGERIGVAVSGGADSVALLLLLLELRNKLGIVLSVVHLNHKLRGRAADADERFVEKLAAKYRLMFHVEHADISALVKKQKGNLEETARRARYVFFERLAAEGRVDTIAVAHTADDQAETVLAHIFRGTGLAGLAGIHPVAGRIFRPLLGVRRAELRTYLRAKKQTWREDVTNRDLAKMRARVRRKLLPLLEKEFQGRVVEHLTELAELAREDEAFLDALAKAAYRVLVLSQGQTRTIGVLDLLNCAKNWSDTEVTERKSGPVSKRLVRIIVKEIKGRAGQLNADHVGSVLRLAAHGENGKSLQLPGGVLVRRENDKLLFSAKREQGGSDANTSADFAYSINLRDKEFLIPVPELGCAFRFMAIDWPEKTRETRYTGSALDRDALRPPLVLRNWRPGDNLHPVGHRNAHKLKRLLNKAHVSRWERHGWPVLTSGGVLAWARGFPVAAEFAANERTRAGIVIVEERVS
jgi:tRNA(Ile)-lysidine synthase